MQLYPISFGFSLTNNVLFSATQISADAHAAEALTPHLACYAE